MTRLYPNPLLISLVPFYGGFSEGDDDKEDAMTTMRAALRGKAEGSDYDLAGRGEIERLREDGAFLETKE